MKPVLVILFGMILVCALVYQVSDSLLKLTDEKNMAESRLYNTEHIKGEVVEKQDKSYVKKEGYALFFGGGERKVEDYQVKLKYDKDKYKTIKIDEQQYLNVNKSDIMNIVIDTEDNTIKYNLKDKEDKEIYEDSKKKVK
ncbi:hypothetical protein NGB25_12950 [Staphylococcus saprophyticus]|uniref:hypothetical protein n=1 Tax=Staphylococcus saprophyticus TaxID=29385 RepID=UPI002DB6F6AF|nr:hypothetical protein [Staphylococcus saprophyticus]MEB7678009.1 hypothetical protein [Staphylococcus saprophyticus]